MLTNELSPLCRNDNPTTYEENQTGIYPTFFLSEVSKCLQPNELVLLLIFSEFPTDIVLLAVWWRLRYKLSLRDVAETSLERGFVFTHETLRDWKSRFAPWIADQLRTRRRGQEGNIWDVDETYLKVHGKWRYLDRAIDGPGIWLICGGVEKRDMDAAKQFFKQAMAVVGHAPEYVTSRRASFLSTCNTRNHGK